MAHVDGCNEPNRSSIQLTMATATVQDCPIRIGPFVVSFLVCVSCSRTGGMHAYPFARHGKVLVLTTDRVMT
jgi:hypothetical protein